MAKASARSASVYFSFLIFVLVCITLLIVILIIATALQINSLRSDVIQASDRNETATKINSIMTLYDSFNQIINSHIGNYSEIFRFINGNISAYATEITYQHSFAINQAEMTKTQFNTEYISLSNMGDSIIGLCNNSFFNAEKLKTKFVVVESTWTNFNAQAAISEFYTNLHKIILPTSATFLVNSAFNTSGFRKNKPVPGGDYLAIHDDKAGNYYPAKPDINDFTQLKLKATDATSNGRFFIEQPGSNKSNRNIDVQVTTPGQQFSTTFDHFVVNAIEITD